MEMQMTKVPCKKCNGTGYWWNNPKNMPGYKCPDCDTKGYILKLLPKGLIK